MRRISQVLIFCCFAAVGFGFPPTLSAVAHAEDAGIVLDADVSPSDASPLAAGSGSGSSVVAISVPAGHLDDPAKNPLEAWNEVKTAQRAGWPALVFTVLALLLKGLASSYATLAGVPLLGSLSAWLAVGKRAMAVAGGGTVATAIALALTAGTTWAAALMAGALALAGVTHSTTQTGPAI